MTGPRRAIVNLMVQTDLALSPIEVFDKARGYYPKMGLVTVYRTLEILSELGLIERVHQANGCHMYVRSAVGHKHTMLCTNCKRFASFSGDDLEELIQKVSSESGFLIQSHYLQMQGLCEKCKSNHKKNQLAGLAKTEQA